MSTFFPLLVAMVRTPGWVSGRRNLARAVAWLHSAIIMFFLIGWSLPWVVVHWLIIFGGVIMQCCWLLYSNRCPLTLLEQRLLQTPVVESIPHGGSQSAENSNFVARILARISGRKVSNKISDRVSYIALYLSMGLSSLRLAF